MVRLDTKVRTMITLANVAPRLIEARSVIEPLAVTRMEDAPLWLRVFHWLAFDDVGLKLLGDLLYEIFFVHQGSLLITVSLAGERVTSSRPAPSPRKAEQAGDGAIPRSCGGGRFVRRREDRAVTEPQRAHPPGVHGPLIALLVDQGGVRRVRYVDVRLLYTVDD